MMKSSLKTGHKLYMNLAATTNKHQMGGQKDGDQESSPGYPGTALLLLCGLGEEQDKQKSEIQERISQICLYTCIDGHVPAEKIDAA